LPDGTGQRKMAANIPWAKLAEQSSKLSRCGTKARTGEKCERGAANVERT